MPTIFLTGFPGFLGSALIENLLEHQPSNTIFACLVQARFKKQAERKKQLLESKSAAWGGRIQLFTGDITLPKLELGSQLKSLQPDIIEIYHLAAVYDLGVARDLAMQVNVKGTQHMLEFATGCPKLQRFHYVSTCYVSGRYEGTFHEDDLIMGQSFNNNYEETKYLAEVDVQAYMRAGLPTTIYRPSIVVGDSQSGKTQKYDGPYYIMQWILRQPSLAFVPVVGNTRQYEVNVVPSDFVVDAITHLSQLGRSVNKVYHLSDPHPPTVNEMLDLLAESANRRLLRVPIPKSIAKGALEHIKAVQQLMRIKPEAVEYFIHPTRYTCTQTTRDLAGSGIVCPLVSSYIGELVGFMQQNPHLPSAAMA